MDETELKQQICSLRSEYIDSIPVRVDEVDACLQLLTQDPLNSERLTFLHRLCHTLKGSAATFGFNELSHQAGIMEQQIRMLQEPVSSDIAWELQLLLNECEQLKLLSRDMRPAQQPAQEHLAHLSARQRRNNQYLIYLAEDDLHQAGELELILNHAGYQIQIFNTASALMQALNEQVPAALILDLCLPEGRFAGPELAENLQKLGFSNLPILFISARNDWQARFKAMQAGGNGYLCKPIEPMQLTDILGHMLHEEDEEPYRTLIVEDDVLLAQHYQLILNYAGIHTVIETNPEKVLSTAARHQPELILMDLHMGKYNGIEVAQVIRQHQQLFSIPIIFLSSERNQLLQHQAALNGDHFVEKPISDEYLVELVLNRSRRSRSLSQMMYHDGLTGLLNQITLRYRLESELAYRKRHQQSLCFIMLDLDNFKQINDTHGHGCGDTVLKSLARLLQNRMRKSDHVGRIGGEEFGVILPDATLQQAHHIIEALRQQFTQQIHHINEERIQCAFSAGIACSSNHGTAIALMEAADTALYSAKQSGRNKVMIEEISR